MCIFRLVRIVKTQTVLWTKSSALNIWRPMWRIGGNTRLPRKRCGFDCRTVQTFVCMNMSVGSGCFYVWYVCIYKKNVCKYVLIRYLESITQALSAYFGLDSRECKCLEYLLFIIIYLLIWCSEYIHIEDRKIMYLVTQISLRIFKIRITADVSNWRLLIGLVCFWYKCLKILFGCWSGQHWQ
jgi:hypothetical protein